MIAYLIEYSGDTPIKLQSKGLRGLKHKATRIMNKPIYHILLLNIHGDVITENYFGTWYDE